MMLSFRPASNWIVDRVILDFNLNFIHKHSIIQSVRPTQTQESAALASIQQQPKLPPLGKLLQIGAGSSMRALRIFGYDSNGTKGGGAMTHITVEIPEDIAGRLANRWGDISRGALEAIAIEGYRSGALTHAEVKRMLGFPSRWETDEFLKRAGAYLAYTESDLENDLAVTREIAHK
jgi:hypothetical protein